MAVIMKKALFFDVDGTLLDRNGHIPESTVQALKRTRECGNLIFINSGRIRPLARFVENFVRFDGFLCGCGTEIIVGETCIYRYEISKETVSAIREDCVHFDMDLLLEGTEGIWISPELRNEHVRHVARNVRQQGGEVPPACRGNFPVSKFCMQRADSGRCPELEKKYGEAFHMMFERGFYECVPRGHDKAHAIQRTLEYLNIPPEDAYAFGDGLNDLEALRIVPHAVVMGEHAKELEPYAELITKRLEDGGIAYALDHLRLL